MKSFEMQPKPSMRRAFSMDNYTTLETSVPMNNTTNGHSYSYVDTEVKQYYMMYRIPTCIYYVK